MLDAIGDGIEIAIDAIGSVFSAIFTSAGTNTAAGSMNAILPVVGLGLGFYCVSRGIGYLKSLVQGY